jgi:hypothetical protein
MDDLDIFNTINITGSDSQTIHIILKRNEKINVNKNYISYSSSDNLDEIIYSKVDSLFRQNYSRSIFSLRNDTDTDNNKLKKVSNESVIRLKNKNNNIEYLGLSKGGKIMKITPILYNNLYIKIENILAFNDGVELLSDMEIDQKINGLNQQNNVVSDMIDSFLFNRSEYCLVRSKLKINKNSFVNEEKLSLLNLSSYVNDFVYISGYRNLMEKRLGENESMVLMSRSIVAFEQTITFSHIKSDNKINNKYVNSLNDIIVEGPGLIIFELTERRIILSKNNNKIFIISFVLLFFEIIAQLIVHYNFREE